MTAVDFLHVGFVFLDGNHPADQLYTVFFGQKKGENGTGADADVINPESAEGTEESAAHDAAGEAGANRQNGEENLNEKKHHRS